ncbi:MAG: endonuclease/exonuclease/phosphatase family protein [Oscillospiraceae bacterium]|jgi:endonuclease/exonuclease/phosphatase family metal-dependent hydrolase|nr:endonuclease/exonuclease/phosphatase family protein [Oscillospiraceae bacterium]
MKIVSYNIKCDLPEGALEQHPEHFPEPMRRNTFAARSALIREVLEREKPDIVGFQELQPHMVRWMKENLPEYAFVGHGREKALDGEHMLLGYRRDKLDLWGLETFWLSPDPYVPGSRYEDQSICPRVCTTALLHGGEFPFPFRVYLTHLDHESVSARMKGLSQILRKMEDDTDRLLTPCFLMGDFNAQPGDVELSPIKDFPSLGLRDLTENVGPTFHNFGQMDPIKIDYIFATAPFELKGAGRWHEDREGIYLSDHDPVYAEVTVSQR